MRAYFTSTSRQTVRVSALISKRISLWVQFDLSGGWPLLSRFGGWPGAPAPWAHPLIRPCIKECHVILDQSRRRISYVHLCKNTKMIAS